jgi:hypothetical protein
LQACHHPDKGGDNGHNDEGIGSYFDHFIQNQAGINPKGLPVSHGAGQKKEILTEVRKKIHSAWPAILR